MSYEGAIGANFFSQQFKQIDNLMFQKEIFLIFYFFCLFLPVFGQDYIDNKFTTFGIIALDKKEQSWGCAIATNNLAIGQDGVFEISPETGIIVSIAFTNPDYPVKGIKMLQKGYSLQATLDSLQSDDDNFYFRQIGMLDREGNTLGYTGNTIKSYSFAGTVEGKNFIVIGNSLANDSVLIAMADAFEKTTGPLYERLLTSLNAGQKKGGQKSGKLSAAIQVKKTGQTGFNEVDYRVDFSKEPFEDLKKLVDKKKGLSYLRKANKLADADSILYYLDKSANFLDGWTLLYPEVAKAYYKKGYQNKAVDILKRGMKSDPHFIHFLPWCYYLSSNLQYAELIQDVKFNLHDWLEALTSLIDVEEFEKAGQVAKDIRSKYPHSSYLYFLTGKLYEGQGQKKNALKFYEHAYSLDHNNTEAYNALKRLKK